MISERAPCGHRQVDICGDASSKCCMRTAMRATPGLLPSVSVVLLMLMLPASCSRNAGCDGGDLKIDENLYGFYLGESYDELFDRSHNVVAWERMDVPYQSRRGDIYHLSGSLDNSPDVDHVRLTFLDGCLWEIIVYFAEKDMRHLDSLKQFYEDRFGARAKAPPGTIEKVFKTYWLPGPGMGVTLRLIKKPQGDELYVQFQHNILHKRLIERNRRSGDEEG